MKPQAVVRRQGITLSHLLADRARWDARGIVSDIRTLETRGEGEWIPTPWDADSSLPGTQAYDIHPHLLRIHQGRVLARTTDTAVYTACNQIVGFGASSFLLDHDDQYVELRRHPFYRRSLWHRPFEWLTTPRHFAGPLFLLHAPWSHNNYYHFLMDLMPRLGIFLSCRQITTNEIPIITTIPLNNSYRTEVLDRSGHGHRIESLRCDPWLHLSADELYIVSLSRTRRDISSQSVHYLRSLFQEEIHTANSRPRRLLVLRGPQAQRALLNENEVARALIDHGFETVQPELLSVAAQARLFASAEVVVGQHGAGLTNVAFCRSGCTVVELFTPPWHDPHYERITRHVHGDYVPFHCEGFANHSLRVDLESLMQLLRSRGLA